MSFTSYSYQFQTQYQNHENHPPLINYQLQLKITNQKKKKKKVVDFHIKHCLAY